VKSDKDEGGERKAGIGLSPDSLKCGLELKMRNKEGERKLFPWQRGRNKK
jgi:hypothetical protein